MKRIRIALAALTLVLAVNLAGCSAADDNSAASSNEPTQAATVQVEKRDIVPTLSASTAVISGADFVVSTVAAGNFTPNVAPDEQVKAGQVLGWNGGQQVTAPADALVKEVSPAAPSLPANYPVVTLRYQGFAFEVDAGPLLLNGPLEGKFQIDEGVGPTDIAAIVRAPASVEGSSPSSDEAGTATKMLCLVAKDVDIRPGQVATVVLHGKAQQEALVLPVSAVAGRVGQGEVTVVKDGKQLPTTVGLGVSDGAYIQITSGLSQGETVSSIAPYLDPRRQK